MTLVGTPWYSTKLTQVTLTLFGSKSGGFHQPTDRKSLSCCRTCVTRSSSNQDECASAFKELRQRLVSAPVLAFPDFHQPFIMDTDASDMWEWELCCHRSWVVRNALYPMLCHQTGSGGCGHLRPTFRLYLLGTHFLLWTDHSSLICLWNIKKPEGQLTHWLERLQEYDFTVQYRSGTVGGILMLMLCSRSLVIKAAERATFKLHTKRRLCPRCSLLPVEGSL